MDDQERSMDNVESTDDVVSITRHEGLFETLNQPESLLHLRSFLTTPGIGGTSVAAQLNELRPTDKTPNGGPLLTFGWRSAAHAIADFLMGRKVEVVAEETSWLPFKLHVVHCPPVDGAEANLRLITDSTSKSSCRLSVVGVGGGPEFSVAVKVSTGFKTTAKSMSVVYAFETVWQHCHLIDVDGSRTAFPRLKELRKNSRRITPETFAPINPRRDWGSVVEQEVLDLRDADDNTTRKLEVTAGTSWEASAETEIFGFKAGPKYTLDLKATNELEYVLPKGHTYTAARYAKMPWWWWSVQ
jgi:hypothetical protein